MRKIVMSILILSIFISIVSAGVFFYKKHDEKKKLDKFSDLITKYQENEGSFYVSVDSGLIDEDFDFEESWWIKSLSASEENVYQNLDPKYRKIISFCTVDDNNFDKCIEHKNALNERNKKDCEECDQYILNLFEISASLKNEEISNDLTELVDLIKNRQEINDSNDLFNLSLSVFEKIYCVSEQNNIARKGSDDSRYEGMMIHFVKRERCLNELGELEGKLVALEKELNEQVDELNKIVSKINGNYNLKISHF